MSTGRGNLLRQGQQIGSALTVDRLLGEGAFAEVYRVRHHMLGWQALKLFKNVASRQAVSGMLDEARLLMNLEHPNIIRVFDANTVQSAEGMRGYLTMEYVAGGSLERLVDSHRGAVPVGEAMAVLRQTAEGLAVAHGRQLPIVHRDLSLSNVLITYGDSGLRTKISDFGLAKEANPFTMAASAQGTLAFMPPEVVRDGKGYTCAGDVWALGTIAYFLLTTQFPYSGPDPVASFSTERFSRPLIPPSTFNDEVPHELNSLVTDMLRIDPGERPGSAQAVAERASRFGPVATRMDTELVGAGRPRAVRESSARTNEADSSVAHADAGAVPDRRNLEAVREAIGLSRIPGRLAEATDLLEEAISREPTLREQHLSRLATWRKKVVL
jgi:serine/threonine protein kinase